MPLNPPQLTRRQRNTALGMLLGVVVVSALATVLFRGTPAPAIASFAQCAQAGYVVSDTNPPACSDGRHAFVGPATAAADASSAPGQSLPFELMVEGNSGGNYPQRQELIVSQSDWERYWKQVHAGLHSTPPILPVDFSASNVVALSNGQTPTTGYNLKITSITSSANGSVVDYTLTVPTITCKVAVTPSDRYFIARTPKLTPPVSFRLTTTYHRCD